MLTKITVVDKLDKSSGLHSTITIEIQMAAYQVCTVKTTVSPRLMMLWRMWMVLVLFQAVSCEDCKPTQTGKCQFPFVMDNVSLHTCTWYRSYLTGGYPWCSTEGETEQEMIPGLLSD